MRTLAVRASFILVALLAVALGLSFVRMAGWVRTRQVWVEVPASGMQELHTAVTMVRVYRGRFEASRTESLACVVPIGSMGAGETRNESGWMWVPAPAERVRSWDDRWHATRWDEWRLGDTGWYATTGGGESSRVCAVPIWLVMMVAGTPLWIGMAAAARARRRRKSGRCVACGYQRGGLSADAPCPECGKGAG